MCMFLNARDMCDECRVTVFSRSTNGVCLCCLTFEVTGARRQDALAGLAKLYRLPPTGPWWLAVARPVDRVVRPRSSRSGEELRMLEAVPRCRARGSAAVRARQRAEWTAGTNGGARCGREAG